MVISNDDSQEESVKEIAVLDKDCQRVEHLGLTRSESKELLRQIQRHRVQEQVTSFLQASRGCADCNSQLRIKGYKPILFPYFVWQYYTR